MSPHEALHARGPHRLLPARRFSRWPRAATMRASSSSTRNGAAFCRSTASTCRAGCAHAARATLQLHRQPRLRRRDSTAAPRPARTAKTPGSIRTFARSIWNCTSAASRTASKRASTESSSAGSTAWRSAGRSSAKACSRARPTPAKPRSRISPRGCSFGGFRLLDAQFIDAASGAIRRADAAAPDLSCAARRGVGDTRAISRALPENTSGAELLKIIEA